MRQALRLLPMFACLIVAASLLSACTGIPKPFAREKSFFNASDPSAPPVTITAVNGAPKAAVDRMVSQLYTESKLRGFNATVGRPSHGAIRMTGHMTAAPSAKGTAVLYVWDVYSPKSGRKLRISGEVSIPGGQTFSDPWAAVDDASMQQVAQDTADQLAVIISQLGYDVRMASVPPPASMLTDGADSIQTASITQGHKALVSPAGEEPVPEKPAAPSPTRVSAVQSPPPGAPEARAPKARNTKPRKRANAIAVPAVVGAKGRGNAELSAAMREAMAVAGVPVEAKQRKGAITVAGTVKLSPPSGSKQTVELAWRVLDAEGALLGTISQKNEVPAGSLDAGFGNNAKLVAQAAAGGIFKLLSSVE